MQEVKIESETRAIVFAKVKDVSPIPAGSEPDDHDRKNRENGFRFKYLVEKSSEGWRVSQVYKFDDLTSKYYPEKDAWEKVYTTVRDKPSYPAFILTQ